MSDIREILEDAYRIGHTDATLHVNDWETLKDGVVKAAETWHKAELERVIGEDEPYTGAFEFRAIKETRNKLRAEQRKRAGLSQDQDNRVGHTFSLDKAEQAVLAWHKEQVKYLEDTVLLKNTVIESIEKEHLAELERDWWITDHTDPNNHTRILGPFTTNEDAGVARNIVERYRLDNRTFWIEQFPKQRNKAGI